MSFSEKIDKAHLPNHIAIIMDGNGRWAKSQNKERSFGHQAGIASVRRVTEAATKLGIGYLTLYTFSTENWNRPVEEIEALMSLLVMAIERETPTLVKNNIRLSTIGDMRRIPVDVLARLNRCIEKMSANTGLTLVLALSYSSRWEITEAVKVLAECVKTGILEPGDITTDTVTSHLSTRNIPDPDLLIRTGGELRISNFLLWQLAYAELFFTETFWPDFNEETFYEAIVDYQMRERRYGKTSEQL